MFCLRTKDAGYFLSALREVARSNDLSIFDTDRLRYCSLNLKSLFKFGSVEFRTLATPKTAEPIVEWISIINSLYLYSLTLNTPNDVLSLYSDKHEEYLLTEVFKVYADCLKVQELKDKVRSGFRHARLLIKTVDWDSFFIEPKTRNPFHKVVLTTQKRAMVLPKVLSKKFQGSVSASSGVTSANLREIHQAENRRFVQGSWQVVEDEFTHPIESDQLDTWTQYFRTGGGQVAPTIPIQREATFRGPTTATPPRIYPSTINTTRGTARRR
jgi:hypothetical protein